MDGPHEIEEENLQGNTEMEITTDMIKEEELLHTKSAKDEEQEKEQVKQALAKENEKLHEMRFQRLEFLLKKSSLYTTYLLNRIKTQESEEKVKQEKRRKRLLKRQENTRKKRQVEEQKLREKRGDTNKASQIVPTSENETEKNPTTDEIESKNRLTVGNLNTKTARKSPRSQANTPLSSPRLSRRVSARNSAKNSPQVVPQVSPNGNKENKPVGKPKKRKADDEQEHLTSDILSEAVRRVKKQKLEDDGKTEEASIDSGSQNSQKDEESEKRQGTSEEDARLMQPQLFTGGTLRHYQIEGYKWLRIIYENGINGILADEMGLGKTIQCIALIADIIENGIDGPFLIVVPLSTVPNWISEFKRFAPKIPTLLYHGSKEDRMEMRTKIGTQHPVMRSRRTAPVVVTSYEIAMNDRKYIAGYEWKLIIVDEGHRIKNFQCRLIKELKLYRTTHRLLLTGTPLQNNLTELWSLLNFLLPEIFDDLSSFESWFDVGVLESQDSNTQLEQAERSKSILTMLHNILNPFMLRRIKADVELDLPPKREVLVYAPMTAIQQTQYKSIVDRSIRKLVEKEEVIEKPVFDEKGRPKRRVKNRFSKEAMHRMFEGSSQDDSQELEKWCDDVAQNTDHTNIELEEKKLNTSFNIQLRNVMVMLRKCTNHPYLIEYPLNPDGSFKIDEELASASGKLLMLDCMLSELRTRGHKVLLFSQMTKILDILEDFCYLRGYNTCRLDGSMKIDDRREQIESFNTDPEVFIFLLSTRAGGLGLNLVAADTCIIFDSDWNPQNDLQAQDRCHRIGQTRPVMVYRLVTANTVDQRIVERAAAKRRLEKMVIQKGRFKDASIERLTRKQNIIDPQEILELLQSSDYDEVVSTTKDSVISKDALNSLLDRSDLLRTWKQGKQTAEKDERSTKTHAKEPTEVKGVFKIMNEDKSDTIVTS